MLMTKNDNGNGNKVLCKVRKEWQWQRSKALKNFVSLEKHDPADLPSQKAVPCGELL